MLVTRRAVFSASHVCRNPALSDQENEALYGPESRPHGHGHDFVLEVTLEGEPDPVTGMVYDLKRLKDVLEREITGRFDHRFLNSEVEPFGRVIPTVENMAVEIWRRLEPCFQEPGVRLRSLRLRETEDLWVDLERGAA
ncbi:MAG TPA: 6-carboxytetrahydropterin synthase [Bryobacteraceae bacterium]|nr:6-carboxytetrahydropterin synthase [Bryobacteraceae bacterium]